MNPPATTPTTSPLLERQDQTGLREVNKPEQQLLETVTDRGQRIQDLIASIETVADPNARMLAQECMQSILEFYGAGLERILFVVQEAEKQGRKSFEALTGDSLVGGLLLIHGLHPLPLENRLSGALERVRPYMHSHGGDVELLSLVQGRAMLRLVGTCDQCESSAVTLELALRHAIQEACPDLAEFEVEGGAPPAPTEGGQSAKAHEPEWVVLSDLHQLPNGSCTAFKVAKTSLVICKLDDQLYAYRDQCPSCNTPLHLGTMDMGILNCVCNQGFDIRAAGRSLGTAKTHLDPFPLLTENGIFRVSVR